MQYIIIALIVMFYLAKHLILNRKHEDKLSPGIKELYVGVPNKKYKIMLSLSEFLVTRLILAVLIGFVLPHSVTIAVVGYFITMLSHFLIRIVKF